MGQEADCPEEESIAHPTYIIGQIVLIEQHTRLLGQMRGASHPDSSDGRWAPASMLIPYILPGVVTTRGHPDSFTPSYQSDRLPRQDSKQQTVVLKFVESIWSLLCSPYVCDWIVSLVMCVVRTCLCIPGYVWWIYIPVVSIALHYVWLIMILQFEVIFVILYPCPFLFSWTCTLRSHKNLEFEVT